VDSHHFDPDVSGVSFAHGTNDGQKGMGLLMLVLIVVLPSALALNPDLKPEDVHWLVMQLDQDIEFIQAKNPGKPPLAPDQATKVLIQFVAATGKMNDEVFRALGVRMAELRSALANKNPIEEDNLMVALLQLTRQCRHRIEVTR
jgi:inorganic phosphate transporter, PiT family